MDDIKHLPFLKLMCGFILTATIVIAIATAIVVTIATTITIIIAAINGSAHSPGKIQVSALESRDLLEKK